LVTQKGENKSVKVEIQVVTVLSGFYFVLVSILITMPEDVIETLKLVGLRVEVPGILSTWIHFSHITSILTFVSSFVFLTAIPIYLIYLNRKNRTWILLTARTLLVIEFYFMFILSLFYSGFFLFRVLWKGALTYLNPILSLALLFGAIVSCVYIFYIWRVYWKPYFEKIHDIIKKYLKYTHRTRKA